ncbi:MAG: hypothetical protein EOO08_06120 [Chitinophagaceae bacterium]|nr:MAG: hypothetical protein EOO08_06120 [Chitinophagaceae bacterium]
MSAQFNIPVRIESLEKRRRMTGVLHVIAAFYLLAVTASLIPQRSGTGILSLVPFLVVALGTLVYGIFRRKFDPTARYNSAVRALMAIAMGLLALTQTGLAAYGLYAWTILSVMLLFSEKVLFQPSNIELTEAGIGLPGSPKPPVLPWTELENIIVRADYLTLFRNDKKFVQLEVTSTLDPQLIADADAFGKAQIRKQAIPV